jgi:hypothetical protein
MGADVNEPPLGAAGLLDDGIDRDDCYLRSKPENSGRQLPTLHGARSWGVEEWALGVMAGCGSDSHGYAIMPIFIDRAAASHHGLNRETDIAVYSRDRQNNSGATGFLTDLSRQRS